VGGIIYSRFRHFRIPFQTGAGEQRLKQLQLYVSTDQGKSWQPAALAPPEQRHFKFMTDRDGFFWFAVQTQDQEGRLNPPSMEDRIGPDGIKISVQPSLKVIVDSKPPAVALQPLAPRGGEVGVSWDIRDDNLDLTLPDAIQLDYRPVGSGGSWIPLLRQPGTAQAFWNPHTQAAVEVRLRARDRAGNWGEATTLVSLAGVPQANSENPNPNTIQGPAPAERRLVNSKRITLNYELKEVGPSGVSAVDLWYTQDGRSWNKYPPRPGEDANQRAVAFEVQGEGLYGLTLVARSGVGLGIRPPQLGDRPQIWVEVDLTKPEVQLHSVVVGLGADKGKLAITWSARDKNLHKQPITLSYAEHAGGPWTTIVEHQANTGRYVWTMPDRVPYQFHVRVEAADRAGNVGAAVTAEVVKVDLSQPRVNILNVEPATK
jgi:hypothetical protein